MRTADRITALYPDQSLQRFVEKATGTLPIEIRSCGGVPLVSARASGGRLRQHSGVSPDERSGGVRGPPADAAFVAVCVGVRSWL